MCDKSNCIEYCIHDYEATIKYRTNGDGCPFCCNHKLCIHNSIKYTHPNIVKEWHPFKNGDLNPENYKVSSNKKIWWLCSNICKDLLLPHLQQQHWYQTLLLTATHV